MSSTSNILPLLSLLHEPATRNSATRRFRGDAVLSWTLRRLSAANLCPAALLCWDDQAEDVQLIASATNAIVIAQGPRRNLPNVQAIAAARRWADGWRSGPIGASAFDNGFDGPAVMGAMNARSADAVLLVDPSAALVDPAILSAIARRWRDKPDLAFVFSNAATGLGGMLVARSLVEPLAAARTHPGRVLAYFPDQISREPTSGDSCVPAPTPAARTIQRFTLDSDRQVNRVTAAMEPLNGQLLGSGCEALALRMNATSDVDSQPREVVLELTTRRLSRPIFSPLSETPSKGWHGLAYSPARGDASTSGIDSHGQRSTAAHGTPVEALSREDTGMSTCPCHPIRPDLDVAQARRVIDELAVLDDSRLTLAGVGDPLLHADVFEIIDYAASRGVSVHVETDLLTEDVSVVEHLGRSAADVISVHIPALTEQTYADVMGVDGYRRAMANVQALVTARVSAGRGTPLLIPIFTKCRVNLHEMEAWYDQWLDAVGSAVIAGPTTFGGLIPDAGVAGMSPPRRMPCRRLTRGLTVLSDGQYTTCEQDALGSQSLGSVRDETVGAVWQGKAAGVRKCHADSRWSELSVCARCTEWHR